MNVIENTISSTQSNSNIRQSFQNIKDVSKIQRTLDQKLNDTQNLKKPNIEKSQLTGSTIFTDLAKLKCKFEKFDLIDSKKDDLWFSQFHIYPIQNYTSE